ncbi:hypothetical protein KIL84_023386, partial [Mauremys mutica]
AGGRVGVAADFINRGAPGPLASLWGCPGQSRTGARARVAAAGKQQHINHMMSFNLADLFSTAQFYQLPTSDM